MKDGKPGLGLFDNTTTNQFWNIEKTDDNCFRLMSIVTETYLSVSDSSLVDSALVIVLPNPFNQWLIDDYGYGLCRITANHSLKCLAANPDGTIMQLTDAKLAEQRWVLEDIAVEGKGNGILGEYFNNVNFTTLVKSRIDERINFNWGLNAPISGMPVNHFAIRWSGKIEPKYPETYTFFITSDDGARLWVNDSLIINDWTARATKEISGTIKLQLNKQYNLKLEYFDNDYDAIVNLEWESPTQEREIVPKSQFYGVLPKPDGINQIDHNEGLKIYPNPAPSSFTLEYTLNSGSPVTIKLMNLQGQIIKLVYDESTPGKNRKVIDTSGLIPGIYQVNLSSEKQFLTTKLIVQ